MTKWYGAMTPVERGQRGLKNETSVPAKTLGDFVTRGIPDMFPLFDDKFKEFIKRIQNCKESGLAPNILTYVGEIWTSIKLVCYLKWNGVNMTSNMPKK